MISLKTAAYIILAILPLTTSAASLACPSGYLVKWIDTEGTFYCQTSDRNSPSDPFLSVSIDGMVTSLPRLPEETFVRTFSLKPSELFSACPETGEIIEAYADSETIYCSVTVSGEALSFSTINSGYPVTTRKNNVAQESSRVAADCPKGTLVVELSANGNTVCE